MMKLSILSQPSQCTKDREILGRPEKTKVFFSCSLRDIGIFNLTKLIVNNNIKYYLLYIFYLVFNVQYFK